MARRKVNLGGREVMAEEIEFEAEKEGWNSYILPTRRHEPQDKNSFGRDIQS